VLEFLGGQIREPERSPLLARLEALRNR
jgi:hypothetical protein